MTWKYGYLCANAAATLLLMKSLILLMNKKNTVGYLIGLSAISLALVLSMTLSNNNGAIAQQSSPSSTSIYNHDPK